MMLPDVLEDDLRIVFCGTAASRKSAELRRYYAGPGNKFWKVLKEVGLTPILLSPQQYLDLPQYKIGLTDLVKHDSGMDYQVDFKTKGAEALRTKILRYEPRVLCFNGKRAAQEFLSHPSIDYGLQEELIGPTLLFVAPSTSGAACGSWDVKWWFELASYEQFSPSNGLKV